MDGLIAHADATSSWQPAPLVLAGAAVALWLFAAAFVRLNRSGRSDLAPWWRAAAFSAGILLGVLVVVSPLDSIAEQELVSAHMLQHVVLGDLVPVLLLVGLRGPLLWMATPRPVLRALHRAPKVRAVLALLFRPAVAFSLWIGTLALWHIPALYEAALSRPLVHDLEHATFFLGGILVWSQLIDPAGRHALSPLGRLAYAVAMLAAGGALVNVLVFSGPLYPSYADADGHLLGLSPAVDQQAAGLVMLFEQLLTVGTFVALLLARRATAVVGASPAPAPAQEHPLLS